MDKTRKIFVGLITVVTGVCMLFLAGCAAKTAKTENVGGYETMELRYQGSTGSVSLPELAEDLGYLEPIKLNWLGNVLGGPESIQATATGETEFGSANTGAIVNLLANGAQLQLVITTAGTDKDVYAGYYVLADSPIKNGRDLIGKKFAVNTLAAHHEFVIKEYLFRQGLTPEEIKEVTLAVTPPVNGEQVLRQKQVDAVALSTIYQDKALERGGIRALFTDYELYGSVSTTGLVMTKKFIKENPKTARKFVEAVAKAIEWTRTTPREEVIARFQNIISKRGRNENDSAIKYWRSTGVASTGGVTTDKDVQLWIDLLVKNGSIKKDRLKPADVYTNELNPFADEVINK